MKFLTEDISEYVEGINCLNDLYNYKGSYIVYQRTGSHVRLTDKEAVRRHLTNIRTCGLSREFGGDNGEMYGEGLYTSLKLRDCQNNSDGYGQIILKLWVPSFKKCFIDRGCFAYGEDLAVKTYGHNASFDMQVERLLGPEFANRGFRCVSDIAHSIPEKIYQEKDIDGLVTNWGGSGHWVCIWKDYKKIFPLEYSLDFGKTFHRLGDETTIKNVLQNWEPSRVLGSDVNKYKNGLDCRVINGFMKVEFNEGGYNFINPKQPKVLTSSVNFDKATDADENGVAVVKYNNNKYYYHIPTDTIYEYDSSVDTGTLLEVAEDFDMLVGTSKNLKSMPVMEENIIKVTDLIKEDIDEYIPGANRDTIHDRSKNGLITFYRLSFSKQVQSIATNGFSKEFRGTGNDNTDWLGSGTYGVLKPHWYTGNYGTILWAYGTPAKLVADTYISPDPNLAAQYGIKGTFAEQLERFFPDLVPKWKANGVWREVIRPGYSGSNTIKKMNAIVFNGDRGRSDQYYHSHGINGIIYHGNGDGDCALTFDDSTIIPLAWRDNSKRGSEWHRVDISDTLWDRTFNGYDPLAFLKGTYKKYSSDPNYISQNYRVVNGYMKVQYRPADEKHPNPNGGKFNYVKAPEGGETFASQTWFDNATDLDKNQVGIVKYNGTKYYYHAPTDTIYEYDTSVDTGTLLEVGEDFDMLLGTSKDLPSIAGNPSMEEKKTVFGELLTETLKK